MMVVDNSKCTLCLECVKVCPKSCRYPCNNRIMIVHEVCANCEYCIDVCPEEAIKVEE